MLKRTLIINGAKTTLVTDVEDKLSDVLRKQLGLTGTKVGCNSGECGTCTVILNGKLVRACITKMKKIEDNDEIITIEGVGTKDKLHPLQIAWMVYGAAQCGYCTPGSLFPLKFYLSKIQTQHVKTLEIGSKKIKTFVVVPVINLSLMPLWMPQKSSEAS